MPEYDASGIELVILLSSVFWIIGIPEHRKTRSVRPTLYVGMFLGRLAGSKNGEVDLDTFAYQLGFGTTPIWYILVSMIKVPYMLATSLLISAIIGWVMRIMFIKKVDKDNT